MADNIKIICSKYGFISILEYECVWHHSKSLQTKYWSPNISTNSEALTPIMVDITCPTNSMDQSKADLVST